MSPGRITSSEAASPTVSQRNRPGTTAGDGSGHNVAQIPASPNANSAPVMIMYPRFGYRMTSNTRVNNNSTISVVNAIRLMPKAILRKTVGREFTTSDPANRVLEEGCSWLRRREPTLESGFDRGTTRTPRRYRARSARITASRPGGTTRVCERAARGSCNVT